MDTARIRGIHSRNLATINLIAMILTGEHFVKEGLIDDQQLELAKAKQKELGGVEAIGRILVGMGFINERDRVRVLGHIWSVPFIDVQDVVPSPEALALISPQLSRKYRALPIELQDKKLTVAMANPLDIFIIDELRLTTGMEIEPLIAVEEDLNQVIATHYRGEQSMSDTLEGVIRDFTNDITVIEESEDELSEAALREMGEEAPIIRLANLIISQGVQDKASDIHIEPSRDGVRVRYRVDGVMRDGMKLPRRVMSPLTSRIKIISDMDIAEKRVPQDNRVSAVVGGREYDFRVSTLPLVNGEKIVMRILDKRSINIGLGKLGFLEGNLRGLEDLCAKSYGILLVTGPTGSGKSTTLYSVLNKINTGQNNIITIEDPVEFEVPGINQCGVNVRAGMTFSAGLRAMLRQDPDIIMVGEMRDAETATIAMEAALTGHMVLSTLHTNDAPGAATRLMDMGVEPFLIASSLNGVLAQRLVRQICSACKEPYSSDRELLLRFGLPVADEVGSETGGELTLFRGKGCEKCNGTGYKGRTGVHELMPITDGLRDLLLTKSPSHILRAQAVKDGMRTLQMDSVAKILMGTTTVDEILRVIYS